MNKTSMILSIAVATLASTSALAAYQQGIQQDTNSNKFVGVQMGLSTIADNTDTNSNPDSLNLYGFSLGMQVKDNFVIDGSFVNQGNYFTGMVDGYFQHSLSSNLSGRAGAGLGFIHTEKGQQEITFSDASTSDPLAAATQFAYQGVVEMAYTINPALELFSGYHYVAWNNSTNSEHANEFLFGMHYYL